MRLFVQGAQARQAARAAIHRRQVVGYVKNGASLTRVAKTYGLADAVTAYRFKREQAEKDRRAGVISSKVDIWRVEFKRMTGHDPSKQQLREARFWAKRETKFPRTRWEFKDV